MNDGWQELRTRSHRVPAVIPDLFSPAECARIVQLLAAHPMQPGLTWDGQTYSVNTSHRDLETAYVRRSADTIWIYERMDQAFFRTANAWGFDVRRTLEDLKYMVYRPGSHFAHWHIDVGEDYSNLRKLSMTVELDDSADYRGGDLQVFPFDTGHAAGPIRGSGTAIIFPSHSYHRVTPVTTGLRRVLVNWISGPPLR
jgi:PKHD-type hydroxylase